MFACSNDAFIVSEELSPTADAGLAHADIMLGDVDSWMWALPIRRRKCCKRVKRPCYGRLVRLGIDFRSGGTR